jgi:hypothetical protein
MKISFKYPARVLTGYTEITTYRTDPDRCLILGSTQHRSVGEYGTRLKTAVVFDRELFIERRIKATGRLVLLSTAVAAVVPVAFLGVAFEKAAQVIEQWATDAFEWLDARTHFNPGDGPMDGFRAHLRDIFQ